METPLQIGIFRPIPNPARQLLTIVWRAVDLALRKNELPKTWCFYAFFDGFHLSLSLPFLQMICPFCSAEPGCVAGFRWSRRRAGRASSTARQLCRDFCRDFPWIAPAATTSLKVSKAHRSELPALVFGVFRSTPALAIHLVCRILPPTYAGLIW
jgi:hypothetical protein